MCTLQDLQIAGPFVSAGVTTLIAILTGYLGVRQWKATKTQVRLAKYERRMQIYEEVKKLLRRVTNDPNMKDIMSFMEATAENDFLFEEEIPNYLKEISDHGLNYLNLVDQYRNQDHTDVNKKNDELKWLVDQVPMAKEMFRKYLDIGKS